MAPTYETIFDSSKQVFPLLDVAAVPLFVLIISIVVLFMYKRIPTQLRTIGVITASLALILSISVFVVVVGSTASAYATARELLTSNRAQVVEGIVRDVKITANGRAESFVAQSVIFNYSEGSVSVGFHHTSSHGGPIKVGKQVRIWYSPIEGDPSVPVILRLDVAK